ncbi:hypothetical protein Pint_12062 [Pistacia integerrima]|uniref:Uncharacterized protein n=1 Tax=Pistacia integerrima TaxID=434235 RepID=A0ACC0XFI3_9ROSI|nr:hypothetical protein Pint_12062 [Pistacia integerrima]
MISHVTYHCINLYSRATWNR